MTGIDDLMLVQIKRKIFSLWKIVRLKSICSMDNPYPYVLKFQALTNAINTLWGKDIMFNEMSEDVI